MNKTYLRGDMYYADLGRGIGSEQEGYRPVVIIQNNTGNKYSPTVIVAAISSKVDAKAKLPTHYLLKAESGLELPSLVLLEQLRTIDKKRLETYIGRLEEKHIRRIDHALAVSVGLIEEVPENLIMCLCPPGANNFYGTGSYYLRRVNPAQQKTGHLHLLQPAPPALTMKWFTEKNTATGKEGCGNELSRRSYLGKIYPYD